MKRMFCWNKLYNKIEIKKGIVICWGFGYCFGYWLI